MEQIQTQASDLRYLATAPVSISDAGSVSYETPQPGAQGSPPGSATFGDNSASPGGGAQGHGNKRKSPDDAGAIQKQTRSKRNRVSLSLCPRARLVRRPFAWNRRDCLCDGMAFRSDQPSRSARPFEVC